MIDYREDYPVDLKEVYRQSIKDYQARENGDINMAAPAQKTDASNRVLDMAFYASMFGLAGFLLLRIFTPAGDTSVEAPVVEPASIRQVQARPSSLDRSKALEVREARKQLKFKP